MGDLVCDGTEFTCPYCTSSLKISVPSSLALGESNNIANLTNSSFPPPGGMCLLKGIPCNPTTKVADPGQSVVKVGGQTALGSKCKFSCSKGGTAQVANPGQGVGQHVETTQDPKKPLSCTDVRKDVLEEARKISQEKFVLYVNKNDPDLQERRKGHAHAMSDVIRAHDYRNNPVDLKVASLTSYDCSGFVTDIYKKFIGKFYAGDIYPVASTFMVLGAFKEVKDIKQAKPGDLIVWLKKDTGLSWDHIGIYSGNNHAISALGNHIDDPHHKKKSVEIDAHHFGLTSVRDVSFNYLPDGHPHKYRILTCIKCIEK